VSNPIVDIRGVGKVYLPSPTLMRLLLRSSIKEPVLALDGVSLQVEAGRICAVVGPNGAGKSTLFRVLTGLTTPTVGEATICGFDVTRQSFEVRKRVGFAPADDRTLLLRNTCRENLMFHGELRGIPSRQLRQRVNETLELVGLGKARDRVGIALSSGMRARLQLARAILHKPEVLILDEPTGSVDPIAAYEILELLRQTVAEEGVATLISSHRLDEVEALHDEVVLLDCGRIVYRGGLDSLRGIWEQPHTEIEFETEEALRGASRVLGRSPDIEIVSQEATLLTVRSSLGMAAIFHQLNGQVNGMKAIRESRMPLHELLAKVLLVSGGEGQVREGPRIMGKHRERQSETQRPRRRR